VGSVYEVVLPSDIQEFLIQMATIATFGLSIGLKITPLACIGLHGYVAELLFWMITPIVLVVIILTAVFLRLVLRRSRAQGNKAEPWKREALFSDSSGKRSPVTVAVVLQQAAPYALRLLFLMYPLVTQVAFQAFRFRRLALHCLLFRLRLTKCY
jgi:uncharacterized protein YacL